MFVAEEIATLSTGPRALDYREIAVDRGGPPKEEMVQRVFGENRVQEAKAKWPALPSKHAGLALHLIGPLQSNKTKEAVERARRLIEQAEALGEPPDDPSLMLSALFGQWIVNFINFNGDVARGLAAR